MTPENLRARAVRLAAAGALLYGLASANGALAQARGGGQDGALRQACASDVKTLCPGIEPGGGRLKQCLVANAAKVSPGCKVALVEAKRAKDANQSKPATP